MWRLRGKIMTYLESLAKDCIENHTHKLVDKPTKQDIYLREESIYISGYKEAERRLKCCANCDSCECYRLGSAYIHCKLGAAKCINYNKWRLKE